MQQIPYSDRAITASTHEGLSICTDCYAVNRAWMTRQGTHWFACGEIPDFDIAVIAAADQRLSITTDGYTSNRTLMTSKGTHFFASRQTPHPDHAITASAHEPLSIHTDRYIFHGTSIDKSMKHSQLFDRQRCRHQWLTRYGNAEKSRHMTKPTIPTILFEGCDYQFFTPVLCRCPPKQFKNCVRKRAIPCNSS